jgi:hypothetical protein
VRPTADRSVLEPSASKRYQYRVPGVRPVASTVTVPPATSAVAVPSATTWVSASSAATTQLSGPPPSTSVQSSTRS